MSDSIDIPTDGSCSADEQPLNPLLESLPDPKVDTDLVRLLAYDPFRDPIWKQENGDPLRLPDHLRTVYIPTKKSLEIASAFYSCVRNGYIRRNPYLPAVWSSFYNLEEVHMVSGTGPVYPNCMVLSGITGLGKSHIVLRVLSTLPQTIHHIDFGPHFASLTQIVWLYIDMSTGAGIKALLLEILNKIDDTLMSRTNYAEQNSKERISVERLINNTIRVLKTHFCGVIVLDEIQKQNFGQKSGSERVRNFLLKLLNTGIPIILVGNPLGLKFEENKGESAQLSRRLQAHAKVRIDPANGHDDSDWKILVRGLWRCQILPVIAPLHEDIQRALYSLTGGFPDFLSALLAAGQCLAIKRDADFLSEELLRDAARSHPLLQEMKPLIDAFVLRDLVRLQRFSDIDHEYYQELWSKAVPPRTHRVAEAAVIESSQNANVGTTYPHSSPSHIIKHRQAVFASENDQRKQAKSKNVPPKLSALGEYQLEKLKALIDSESHKKDGD